MVKTRIHEKLYKLKNYPRYFSELEQSNQPYLVNSRCFIGKTQQRMMLTLYFLSGITLHCICISLSLSYLSRAAITWAV